METHGHDRNEDDTMESNRHVKDDLPPYANFGQLSLGVNRNAILKSRQKFISNLVSKAWVF